MNYQIPPTQQKPSPECLYCAFLFWRAAVHCKDKITLMRLQELYLRHRSNDHHKREKEGVE